jgi:hypothetical protein
MADVKLSELKLNDGSYGLPKNPRFIKDTRFTALCNSIRDNPEYMPARPIIVDEAGVILGGNMRWRACKQLGMKTVPAEWVKVLEGLSVEKKRRFIIMDNRGYGEDDFDALGAEWELDELVLAGFDPLELGDLLNSDLDNYQDEEYEPTLTTSDAELHALNDSAQFASTNDWGIPDLLPNLCKTIPTMTKAPRVDTEDPEKTLVVLNTEKMTPTIRKGILAFYVEDHRFEACWRGAPSFVETHKLKEWGGVLSPDFSIWRDHPLTIQLWNVFRARWCARFWQELGVNVMPSVSWGDSRTYPFCFLGLPSKPCVVAIQCRTTRDRIGKKLFAEGFAEMMRVVDPQNVIVYGGTVAKWFDFCDRCVLLDDWTEAKKKTK